ncbi:MAG: hypothetical protein L0332_24150 [Chloroflexi bacterium]|nr:hypothetical protein [Chloroflexota bacterium]MCI0576972.1 hypothetical protein [Chloroflexota bacterium]MCI0649368.1 hypothetical protein [Chloroflexota bacterium]MCI0729787.1 hypothetical protein [Chloroflexota bacterium]
MLITSVVLMLIPMILTGAVAYMIKSGLEGPGKPVLGHIFIGLGLLVFMLLPMMYAIIHESSWGTISFIVAIYVSPLAVIAGIWLALVLKGTRRIAGALFALGYPAVLFAAIMTAIKIGLPLTPESITEQRGTEIVMALERYRIDKGQYPDSLNELKPRYMNEIPLALSSEGVDWLYTVRAEEFTLGYMKDPDKFGAFVCLYEPSRGDWACGHNQWGPFKPVPTPQPQFMR